MPPDAGPDAAFDWPLRNQSKPRRGAKQRRKRPARAAAKRAAVPDLAWVPPGIQLDVLPPSVLKTLAEVLDPMYEQLVRRAADPLEQSAGLSVLNIMWLEVLGQLDLGRSYVHDAFLHDLMERDKSIEGHLRLIDAKMRVGYFLARLRDLRGAVAAAPSPAAPLLLTAVPAPPAPPPVPASAACPPAKENGDAQPVPGTP